VFEYFWDGERLGWVPWLQLVPNYVHRPELQFNQILVPTVDTVRTTWILDILVKRQCPVCRIIDSLDGDKRGCETIFASEGHS